MRWFLGSSSVVSRGTLLIRLLNAYHSPVPSNFQFQQLDILAEPLPWEPGSFDVIHFRFVLVHVRSRESPNAFSNVVMRNLITYVAPEPPTHPGTYHQARQARRLAAHRRNDGNWRSYGGCTRHTGNTCVVAQELGICQPRATGRRESGVLVARDWLVQRGQRSQGNPPLRQFLVRYRGGCARLSSARETSGRPQSQSAGDGNHGGNPARLRCRGT